LALRRLVARADECLGGKWTSHERRQMSALSQSGHVGFRPAEVCPQMTQSRCPAITFMILSEITTVVLPMNEIYSRVVFSISVHKNVIRNETWVFNVQE